MASNRPALSPVQRPETQVLPIPLLIQGLEILTMPALDLTEHLNQRLKDNILYQVIPPASCEWDDWEDRLVSPRSHRDDLIIQMAGLPALQDREPNLSRRLLDWLDHRGYLAGSEEEIRSDLDLSDEVFQDILGQIRDNLEPPGLFARDLIHCLELQLERKGQDRSDCGTLLKIGPKELMKGPARAAEALGWPLGRVISAIEELSSLDSTPGRFDEASPVVQEVALYPTADRVAVLLSGNLPSVRIADLEWEDRRIEAMRQDGLRVVKDLARRYSTKIAVALALGKIQRAYLNGDTPAQTSATLNDVANITGLCPSTVQRTARSTWATTPRGSMALSNLFSRPLRSRRDMSVAELRWTIKERASQGHRDRTIAQDLGIPLRTISWHRAKIQT